MTTGAPPHAAGRDADAPITFLVFGADWGRHVSTLEHLFRHIVGRHRVVWVDSLGHRQPSLRPADLRRAAEKLVTMLRPRPPRRVTAAEVRPDRVISPRVLPWHGNALAAEFNRWSLTRDVRRALAGADPHGPVVLVTALITAAGVVGRCGEHASVYFCMDDFLEYPGLPAHVLAPLERQLLDRVDVVVATAGVLVERKRARSGRGYHLPQGANYEHFASPRPVPAELASLPRPIVGFAGTVGGAVDFATVRAVAERVPHGSVVLVGPVLRDPAPLRAPNVHLLGGRPYEDLPAFVQAFDVGMIPYVDNDYTHAVDPLKLLEYLSAGIPVVASPIPEMWKYHDVIRIAPLGDEFARAVLETASTATDALRARGRLVARENTWERRADQFLSIVDGVLEEKSYERLAHAAR